MKVRCENCNSLFRRKRGHGNHKFCKLWCRQAAGRKRRRKYLRAYLRAYYHAHREYIIAQRKANEAALNPRIRKEKATKRAHTQNYGPDAYTHFKKQMRVQKRRCAVCGKFLRKPNMDHNHNTMQLRGAVCHGCNSGLGHLEKQGWLKKATAYLNKWERQWQTST